MQPRQTHQGLRLGVKTRIDGVRIQSEQRTQTAPQMEPHILQFLDVDHRLIPREVTEAIASMKEPRTRVRISRFD
jgi:hypothetical protein